MIKLQTEISKMLSEHLEQKDAEGKELKKELIEMNKTLTSQINSLQKGIKETSSSLSKMQNQQHKAQEDL